MNQSKPITKSEKHISMKIEDDKNKMLDVRGRLQTFEEFT